MRNIPGPEALAWFDGEPPKREPTVPIVRARVGKEMQFTLLSGVWHGVIVHNIAGRDTPCEGDQCPYLVGGFHRGYRVKYYTDAWSHQMGRAVLAEASCDSMRPYADGQGGIRRWPRGTVLTLSRMGHYERAPVRCCFAEPREDPNTLPAPFDVKGALLRNWRGDTKVKDD